MRRSLTLLVFLVLLFSFQPAHAQGKPSLRSVEVWIWPEYDRPEVLVIEYILVSPDTTFPVIMSFRIPAAAVKPHAMAVGQTPASVADAAYTLEQVGEWINVRVQVTAPVIQLEYYDPSLSKDGRNREYIYQWPGDYAVENFHVKLQQPFDASGMQTEPSLPDASAVPDGLTYHSGDFGALPAGQFFTLIAAYQKDSDDLSISFVPVEPSAPVDENTAGRVSFQTYLPWLIAGFGVLMIAGGLYYYFRGMARPRPSTRRHRLASSEETDKEQTYCPQCGTRARSGDRFCRTCGARLRTEAES